MGDRIETHAPGGPTYRPDVDGLRAIAILAVLGFHAGGVLPGGFVGVDIFFVISGYLISGIVLRALRRDSFSFADFYVRRIRRIFPALAVMLAATCLAGWYLFLPDEFVRLGKEVAAGAGFAANITFWKESGYFDAASSQKPLLHLWSLGVEEQFYLIWPPMLLIAARRKINPLTICMAVLVGSFVLNVAEVHRHEAATFYLITSRFWELALGGVYACYESTRIDRAVALRTDIMAGAGMVMLIGSIAGFDASLVYPGWWALGPALGTIALIAAGPRAWINRRVLSLRPIVFIGLISYPLYLWHWPLLSFYAIVTPGRATMMATTILLLAAGILAWLTYEYLELPIRRAGNRTGSPAPAAPPGIGGPMSLGGATRFGMPMGISAPLLASVALIGSFGFLAYRGAVLPRSAGHGLEQIMAATRSGAFPGPHLHSAGPGDLLRQGTNSKTVLFIGDSFVEQYYPRIDWLLQTHPQGAESVVFATSGGCPPIPKVIESHHPGCSELLGRAERYAQDPDVDSIVIGADWGAYFLSNDPRYSYRFDGMPAVPLRLGSEGAERALGELQSMIARFRKSGKRVWLILQSPEDAAMNPRKRIESRWGRDSFKVSKSVVSEHTLMQPMAPINSRLREIAAATGAEIIDPVDSLCSMYCPALTADGLPLYRDDGHLNPAFVRTQVHYLDSIVMPDGLLEPARARGVSASAGN